MSYLRRALTFLGYSYLLRVPLLTWAILVALSLGSLPKSGAEPILRGIFDIASPDSSLLATALQFAAVTVATLLAATAIGISSRLVICNGAVRFRADQIDLSPGVELMFRLIPLFSVLAIVITALCQSDAPLIGGIAGTLLGIGFWYLVTVAAGRFFGKLHTPLIDRFRGGAWVPSAEFGYLDVFSGTLQIRHLFATYQFLLAFTAYSAYCLAFVGGHFLVPTLSLVIMLLTLFCWGLSGLAFFLDRYRVPLLIPLFLVTSFSGVFQQGDYFYHGLPLPANASAAPTSSEIIDAYGKSPDSSRPMILIATTGGGIQAAGWTAQVLSGLNQQVALDSDGRKVPFSHFVRLISSVSGGSVGSLFFLANYQNGEVPPSAGPQIIRSAEQSSLDQVTWGLAYPDLLFNFFPFLKGIGVSSGTFHSADSGFIYVDRGRMLENSWLNRLPASQHPTTLSAWANDAAQGNRPAVIFNSTLVETGERYLLATTRFAGLNHSSSAKQDEFIGRWEFFDLYPHSDLAVQTAARLSATFPYVTPAARMLRNDPAAKYHEGRFYQPEPHAVDGGYYDNYGMASLLDWLDNGLQATPARPKILIVEIRAAPTAKRGRPESSTFGGFFQLTNPLLTLAKVRGAGQLSHNGLDENLMNRIYTPQICEAKFEFNATDKVGCPRSEPLNWHLTPDDIKSLDDAWRNSESVRENIARVQSFLEHGTCPQ